MNRLAVALGFLILAGCGVTTTNPPVEVFSDMRRQPKYKALEASPFFSDGRASRPPVPGTVAAGRLIGDEAFETGIAGKMYVGRNALPIDAALLARGRERYDIHCSACHDRAGDGKGIVAVRTAWLAVNLHDERILQMTDGELFNVATYGRRTMPAYRFQTSAADRWAIVAYVRALQRAGQGAVEDVPSELRGQVR
jgi:mono/diheme cytochrome c family protein